jgi:Xaa-Pro aminopeptidase
MNDAGGSHERLYSGDFAAGEMKGRRARVASAIGATAFAIVQGAAKNPTHDLFRQANDFYYLTGVEVPHAYLLIEGKTGKALLFLPHRSRELADREGELLSAENGAAWCDALGVDEVLGVESLAQRLEGVTTLYTPFRQGEELVMSWDTLQRASQDALSDPWDGRVDRASHFLSLLRSRCRRAELRDLSPTLDSLRLVKSPREVELMRVAGRLAGQGIIDAMRCTKPGVMEYQLDAVIRYRYLVEGSLDVAYRSIVAGGANAWYGHYNANEIGRASCRERV